MHPDIPALACLLGLLLLSPNLARAAENESPYLARQREAMKHRTRRIIYNNDGCDGWAPGADTPEGFLAQRMNATLDSQVDSVFYCTGATVMFSHNAKVGETYGQYPSPNFAVRNARKLIEQNTDTLTLVVDFCRKHNLEVFFTHRINDIHDSMESCAFELAAWKREHPEYCLGRKEDQAKYKGDDPRFWWSALDFEIPQVRDYLLAIIADVLTRYDLDGIEIDYFRSPMFFKPNLTYKPASPRQLAILADFQRRVREVAYKEGNRRGRPILVATRVPMTVGKCRHVGIDIKTWLDDDLLDILTTGGGYVPFTMPTRDLVELGHAHNVPVYPTISNSGMRDRFHTINAWRAAAANAWAAGADGIVLFNTFPHSPGHPHFTQLGDPDTLRCADKLFAIDNKKITEGDLEQAVEQDQILPVTLSANRPVRVVLPIGDDVAAAAQQGLLKRLLLQVCCNPPTEGDKVSVRLNGREAPQLDPSKSLYSAPGKIGSAFLFDGSNVLSAGAAGNLQITDEDFSFSLWIKTRQKQDWSGFLVFVDSGHTTGVKLYWNAGVLNFSLRRNGEINWDVAGGDTLLDGQWHHYAATFDRDDVAKAYLDGKLVGARDIRDKAGSLGTDKTLRIGTGDVPFEGLLDDLRLYRRVLSEDEIREIVASPGADGPVGKDALVGWWKFDETSGSTLADASGNGNHARPKEDAGGAWAIYEPDPSNLRRGDNSILFQTVGSNRSASPIQITAVELHVDYKDAPDR
ncbi:MAG: LamG-like jellyroll fold domain-containing protein [Planctomycetota bacterium]